MDCSPAGSSVHGISQTRILGVGCPFLLQGIFLTQGSNLHLLSSTRAATPKLSGLKKQMFVTSQFVWCQGFRDSLAGWFGSGSLMRLPRQRLQSSEGLIGLYDPLPGRCIHRVLAGGLGLGPCGPFHRVLKDSHSTAADLLQSKQSESEGREKPQCLL